MPISFNELNSAMPSSVADKKVQEGLLRIMMQHEMLKSKNFITAERNRVAGKKIPMDINVKENPYRQREQNLDPEIAVVNRIETAKKRLNEMQASKPQLASVDMDAVINGNVNDIDTKRALEFWQTLPKAQQDEYQKTYQRANQDPRHALIQYYSSDSFYEDYPTIYESSKKRLEGQLQMNLPLGKDGDIYNSAAINKLFDNK